jgi:ELWxxDGT repeat protein
VLDAGGDHADGATGSGDGGPFIQLTHDTKNRGLSWGGPTGSVTQWAVVGRKAFFTAKVDDSDGLWVTDGTRAGTRFLSAAGRASRMFAALGDKLVFVSNSDVWTSDGTAVGTRMVKHIDAAVPGNELQFYGRTDDHLFFMGQDSAHGFEMWATDGTEAGTAMLQDINPGPAHTDVHPWRFWTWNGKAYFYGWSDVEKAQLWMSDGTPSGTTRLTPGVGWGGTPYSYEFGVFGDKLFFTYHSAADQVQLWSSDGTPDSTKLFKKLTSNSSYPANFNVLGDKLLFKAYREGQSTAVLWSSDGTPDGTSVLKDLQFDSDARRMQVLGKRALFSAQPFGAFRQYTLWASDGTAGGTGSIASVAPVTDHHFAKLGDDKLVFYAADATTSSYDYEPWVTDGTSAGTHLIVDLYPGKFGSEPGPFSSDTPNTLTAFQGKVYFVPRLSDTAPRLVVTDGTEAGTTVLAPAGVDEQNKGVVRTGVLPFGDRILFYASFSGQNELWAYVP